MARRVSRFSSKKASSMKKNLCNFHIEYYIFCTKNTTQLLSKSVSLHTPEQCRWSRWISSFRRGGCRIPSCLQQRIFFFIFNRLFCQLSQIDIRMPTVSKSKFNKYNKNGTFFFLFCLKLKNFLHFPPEIKHCFYIFRLRINIFLPFSAWN